MLSEYLEEVLTYVDQDYPPPTEEQVEDFYEEGILPYITAVKWMNHVDEVLGEINARQENNAM